MEKKEGRMRHQQKVDQNKTNWGYALKFNKPTLTLISFVGCTFSPTGSEYSLIALLSRQTSSICENKNHKIQSQPKTLIMIAVKL